MPRKYDILGLSPGRKVGPRYVVESLLGVGSEGEVYQIRELDTGILRAAKFYYPHRNSRHQLPISHARKLNDLRRCFIVLQYHHSEVVVIRKKKYVALISDLCEGKPLDLWMGGHPGGRLNPYTALHVLYNLVLGIESVHALGHYHGDVHSQNILIKPVGIGFELKLIDFYDWGKPTAAKLKQDILDTVGILLESQGGRALYARLPAEIRYICAGMRSDLILKRFPTMTVLRNHLESFEWSGGV